MRNHKRVMAAILILTAISGVFITMYFENSIRENRQIKTFHYSNDQIKEMSYFELLFPCAENRGLISDVRSFSFGDGYVYAMLPDTVSKKKIVYYVRDEYGSYFARREDDFTKEVFVGDYQVVLIDTTLPVMYLDLKDTPSFEDMITDATKQTECSGDMSLSVTKEQAREHGWFRTYQSREADASLEGTIRLRGRGNITWEEGTKKSYTLKLEKSQNLLGLGDHDEWNLLGESFDPQLLKNRAFLGLATDLGIKYQAKLQHVNLYINGEYWGVYLLTTKNEVGKNKIPLSKKDYLFNFGDPAPEVYVEYQEDPDYQFYMNPMPYCSIIYPKNPSEKKIEKAQYILQRFYNTIGDTASSEYLDYLDLESMVKYYWVQEISMNFDAWERSCYAYYLAGEDKLYMGPVWDMDFALGARFTRYDMDFTTPQGFRIREAGWYKLLFEHEEFRQAVREIYFNEVREEMFALVDKMYEMRDAYGEDAVFNKRCFGHIPQSCALIYEGDSYEEKCNSMIQFYIDRINWIDEQMKNE